MAKLKFDYRNAPRHDEILLILSCRLQDDKQSIITMQTDNWMGWILTAPHDWKHFDAALNNLCAKTASKLGQFDLPFTDLPEHIGKTVAPAHTTFHSPILQPIKEEYEFGAFLLTPPGIGAPQLPSDCFIHRDITSTRIHILPMTFEFSGHIPREWDKVFYDALWEHLKNTLAPLIEEFVLEAQFTYPYSLGHIKDICGDLAPINYVQTILPEYEAHRKAHTEAHILQQTIKTNETQVSTAPSGPYQRL